MRQHSICYHSVGAYNEFGIYTCVYYISADVKHKINFIMIKVCSLKVGGAGDDNRPRILLLLMFLILLNFVLKLLIKQ